MKLRLPLMLIAALSLAGTIVQADPVIREEEQLKATESITIDTVFSKDVWLYNNGSFTTTIGEKDGAAPVVEMLAVRPAWNSHLNIDNGILKLGKVEFNWWGVKEYSMWIGWDQTNGGSAAEVNVNGNGRIEASSEIWLGRETSVDGKTVSSLERATLNINGGTVIAKGISSQAKADARNPGHSLNLVGGKLILGGGGLAAEYDINATYTTIYKVNLIQGTLGSYESWSTSRRNFNYVTRCLVLTLDSPGYVLPGGTTSDGTGTLTIDAAADTTITLNSLIEGTGTGDFIKSGEGTLFIRSMDNEKGGYTPNTFTQNFVLAGGTLQVDSDGSIGAGQTITVRNDASSKETAFEFVTSHGSGWRNCMLSFDILEGSSLIFRKFAADPANVLVSKNNLIKTAGNALFEGPVFIEGHASFDPAEDRLVISAGGNVVAKDVLYIASSAQATVSGTLTIQKGRAQDGSMQTGLAVGAYYGGLWQNSKVVVEDGGLLEAKDSRIVFSKGRESGELIINAGGRVDVWGLEDTGAWSQIELKGGMLKTGAGGIHFKDWSSVDDGSSKTGDSYLGNVYFSSGKLDITEDSFYRYTGATEFAEKLNEDGTVKRAASTYSGHFFFGKDRTGVLDDPESRREISVAAGATFTFEANILGQGGFNKTGKGVVSLLTANGYQGNTVVEEGVLYVGNDAALGTAGKLVLLSGTTLAAQGKSISLSNNVEMGVVGDGSYKVSLGKIDQTDTLTLGGKVDILDSGATLEVLSHTVFAGDVSGNAATMRKTGAGTLSFDKTLTGVQTMDIRAGKVMFGAEEALSKVKTFKVGIGSGLDMGNFASTAAVDFAGAGSFDRAAQFAGKLSLGTSGTSDASIDAWTVTSAGDLKAGSLGMNTQNARLSVTGGFSAESVTFTLGGYNATFGSEQVKTLITAGSAAVTGMKRGSITLNFDPDYLHTFMNQGGMFQLFSTGVQYNYGTIQNNQKQLVSVDSSQLAATGSITWSKIGLESTLIGQADADAMTSEHPYCPDNEFLYLGAKSGETVKIDSDVIYEVDHGMENYSYKFTAGQGNLVFAGRLTGEENSLYIADYADITEKAEDHSAGYVAIVNNTNDYTDGTNISGSTLVVDLSLDSGQTLTGTNGNLDVHALGTGIVEAVSGRHGIGSVILLRSYGDGKADGISRYAYANEFSLSGGSALVQEGANDQVLTGDIRSSVGSNTISNMSDKSLTLKGNITHEGTPVFNLHTERAKGMILLDGSDRKAGEEVRTLEAEYLNVSGRGMVNVINGYTVTVKGIVINDGTLMLGKEGVLFMGQFGMSGTGTLYLNGGTLKSSSSWNADTKVALGTETNTINTGGANVRLNQGVTGEGGFDKLGTGHLYVYNNAGGNARGTVNVKQGRLILQGSSSEKVKITGEPSSEYMLEGNLILESGKGASLEGMINANNHDVTFGDGTHFYLGVSEADGLTGYIRNAGNITIGTGTQLHVDVLQDNWVTGQTYVVMGANESLTGGENLNLTMDTEFEFVDVSLDLSKEKEVGLYLTGKGGIPGGSTAEGGGTNAGAIHSVVAPLVAGVLDNSTELTGKLHKHMQKISKMTTTEYQTYLTGMGNSASSFYTALSAQVQDATQHINSVRNRVELINPVLYDDWTQGGIYNVWAGGINHYRDVKSSGEAPGYEMTSWGGELGCAIPLSQTFMIGVGFAYTFADVQVKDGWGNNDNDTYNVDFFARYRKDALTITGVLTGGFTNTEFHRNQILKDEHTRSNSSTDGNQFMGTLEVGYDFYLNEEKSWILQPLVNITAGRAKLDGLSETGDLKNAGLMIGSQSYNMFSAGVGAKVAYQYKNSVSDQPGRVELKALYVNDMGDVDFKVNGRFMGAPQNSFDLNGVSNEKSAAIVSAGWVAPISAYGQFFVDAGCEFRKDQNGVNTTVGFSFQF